MGACLAGFADCNLSSGDGCEIDMTSDPVNCGACGNVCSIPHGTPACSGSSCAVGSCSRGHADCNNDPADGCEAAIAIDRHNCGVCGHACGSNESCHGGTCGSALLAQWSFEETTGSTAADSSGDALDGAVIGNEGWTAGAGLRGSGAFSFDGSTFIDVRFPNNARNEGDGLFIPQGDLTFSMWIKTTSSRLNGIQVVTGGGCDRVIGSNGSDDIFSYNSWDEVNFDGQTPVNDGNWHQIVYVLDRQNGLFSYVDGAPDASTTDPTGNCGVGCSGFDWATEYVIGSGLGCRYGAGNFTGLVDEVRMYDTPLSPADVMSLYNDTK
jgi:hypothetical protein